jgi:integrase
MMARRGDGIYLRGKSWWLDFTHRSERHVTRLRKHISRTVAGELARVQRAAILKGEAGIGGPKGKDPLFDDAVKEFVAWAHTNRKARTASDYGEILERLKATFGGRRLSQIDELSIERHKRARQEAEAPVSANRELAVLKSLFNRCRDDLRIYDGRTPRIKLLKENAGRLRFLDSDEEAKLLQAAAEPLRTIVLVGIHTGLRIKSEALALQKTDVDLVRGFLTVQAAYAKNGRTRTVPLNTPCARRSPDGSRRPLAPMSSPSATGARYVPSGSPFGWPVRRQGSPMFRRTPYAIRSPRSSRWPAWTPGLSRISAAGARSSWCSDTRICLPPTRRAPSSGSRLPRNSPTLFRNRLALEMEGET